LAKRDLEKRSRVAGIASSKLREMVNRIHITSAITTDELGGKVKAMEFGQQY
jgi:hypothetical protein